MPIDDSTHAADRPLRPTPEHSILTPWHDLGNGTRARVRRVLRGTRQREWSGTRAYQTGLDVLVSLHRPDVCCWRTREGECADPIVKPFRVRYEKQDPDAWWRMALERSERIGKPASSRPTQVSGDE